MIQRTYSPALQVKPTLVYIIKGAVSVSHVIQLADFSRDPYYAIWELLHPWVFSL